MVSTVSSSYASAFTKSLAMKMVNGNTDGTSGLSKAELSSLTSDSNSIGSSFFKALSDNFDKLDSDQNGEVTTEEIGQAVESGASDSTSSYKGVEDALVSSIKQDLGTYTTSATSTTTTDASSDDSTEGVSASSGGSKTYSKMDLNKDGQVTADEVLKYFEQQSASNSSSTDGTTSSSQSQTGAIDNSSLASKIFAQMDTNKDGAVSAEEISAYVEKQSSTTSGTSNASDTTATTSTQGSNNEDLFSKIDTDKNGEISGDEFSSFLKGNSKPQDTTSTTALSGSGSDNFSSTMKKFINMSENFAEKLINQYSSKLVNTATSALGISA